MEASGPGPSMRSPDCASNPVRSIAIVHPGREMEPAVRQRRDEPHIQGRTQQSKCGVRIAADAVGKDIAIERAVSKMIGDFKLRQRSTIW